MRTIKKSVTRILSFALVAVMLFGAVPISSMAATDAPLTGEVGSGWEDLGDLPSSNETPSTTPEQPGDNSSGADNPASSKPDGSSSEPDNPASSKPDGGNSEPDNPASSKPDGGSSEPDNPASSKPNGENGGTVPPVEPENPADKDVVNAEELKDADDNTTKPENGELSPVEIFEQGFKAYQEWGIMAARNRSARGTNQPSVSNISLGTITWASGDPAKPYHIEDIINKIDDINGQVGFCYQFNNRIPNGTYTVSGTYEDAELVQIMANYEANPSNDAYIVAQVAVWQRITAGRIDLSSINWNGNVSQSAINQIFNGNADINGKMYQLLVGGTQDIIQIFAGTIDKYALKIIKKNEDGSKVLSNATFSVTGPDGFSKTGLKTNSKGEILVNIEKTGTYTVTETAPPAGYEPADPASKTVTVKTTNIQTNPAVVEFRNKKGPPPPPDEGEGDDNFEVTTETKTDVTTEVRNEKSYEYSDAIGQITVRKHDQDGMSLDGALFDIDVAFSDGSHTTVNNWEVDNGARLFTWTHPQDNHDPATVTITEVQPPRYYVGDPVPKTAVVAPTYTRVTHVKTWTITITTETTTTTVTDIESGEVVSTSDATATDEVESEPQVEEFADFVEGDRETTVTFVNQRTTGDIEVTKKDANTGLPLGGATVHLWGEDLGDPHHVDKTLVTDANGIALFDDLPPGTYAIQETQPPFGYNLNDEIQNAVLQSGQVIRKEIRNYRKDGLVIKKVDENGKPLPGAVFELRRGSGEVLLSDVTNENGIIYRGYLTEGHYIIEEIKAPEGYLIDEDPTKELFIYATDDNKEYTVSFVNKKKPAIEITKVDGITPTIKLEGASFRITDSRTGQYWDVQTGKDGTALLEDLEVGTTYIVEELEPPEGYLNSGCREEIVLRESRVHTLNIPNFKNPSMQIVKKDKVTGARLEGATFRISWNDGADYRDVTTDEKGEALITDLKAGWYSITEIKAPEGYLLDRKPHQVLLEPGKENVIELFNEAKPSLTILKIDDVTKTPLQYAKFKIEKKTSTGMAYIGEFISDEKSEVYLENIEPARYLITEIQAPDGYSIDNETHEITIEFGQAYQLEFTNTPKSPIYIQKVDESGAPLIGAQFKVTTMNGAMVGTVTTGRTGYAIIPYAEPGWYIIEEVKAPDGYILSTEPVNVEVKSGRPAQVEFVNYKKPALEILKLDSETKKPLIGAKFKVAQVNGLQVGEYTTDISGLIHIEGLAAGSYLITEIRAPEGYILDMTAHPVELEAGKAVRIELYNVAKPGLQLIKLDKVTGQPVKGAMFGVVELLNGAKKDHGTFTTGDNGTFYIPDLVPGNYVITETKPAPGYIPDTTPHQVFVEGGKLNTIEVYNTPYSDLRLLKIDSDTREPLANAVFKLYDEKRLEIGTYTTSALGEIYVTKLPSGTYFLQEQKAPAGYLLDNTVRQIELTGGKTTTVEWKNTALGSLRIIKVDADTGKPLYGATFLLYDMGNNLLGEFTTDQNGVITFNRNLKEGKYKLKEIKAPENYVLDETIRTVTVKEGSTTEVRVENDLQVGNIQIVKVSNGKNSITKDKEGDGLKGAIFQIFDDKLKIVDEIRTDHNGLAKSKDLPLGKYVVKEVEAPRYYLLDNDPIYAEIKVAGDLIRLKVENTPENLEVDVTKRGIAETMSGETFNYDFADIANNSNCTLDEFYWSDTLPTDAVRIQSLNTGTWSERGTYEAWAKTNLKGWHRIKSKLHTNTEYTIDMRPAALGLASNEYVTEFKLVFNEVEGGFHADKNPFITVRVNNGLAQGYRFTNRTDVGGKSNKEWVYDRDSWITVIYKPNRKLPKTGG